MSSLNEYIGNYKATKAINSWLSSFLNPNIPYLDDKGKTKKLEPYVVIYGSSGNGKTFLVECLSNEYNLDLLRFTTEDFNDIDVIEKSLNLQSITSEKKKLILFDDIQDIKNKRRLYKLHKTSNFPIIFITNNLGKLEDDFKFDGLILRIDRTLNVEMRKILEQRLVTLNIECKNLYDISEQCISVRTALQSILIDFPIVKQPMDVTHYTTLKLMSQQALNEDITWNILLNAFRNIKPINIKSYRLMNELSYFDYVVQYLHFKNKNILLNKIFFNTLPNIELVEPTWKEREYKKKNNQKEQTVVKEIEEVKQAPLSSFW